MLAPTVEQRLQAVNAELLTAHARVAALDEEIGRLRTRARQVADGTMVPTGDGYDVAPPPVPDLPASVVVMRGVGGAAFLKFTQDTTANAELARFDSAVRTYRASGAVSASIELGIRPLEVLPYLEGLAQRWPVVDGTEVLPLVDPARAQFLRDVAEFCTAMGGVAAAARTRNRDPQEVTGWIDEGVRLGVIEWPPPGDVGRAVADLVGR